jgi:hypothetical protein
MRFLSVGHAPWKLLPGAENSLRPILMLMKQYDTIFMKQNQGE